MPDDKIKKYCHNCGKCVALLKEGSKMLPGAVFLCQSCNTRRVDLLKKTKAYDLPEGFEEIFGGLR
jgi:transposase-like protein